MKAISLTQPWAALVAGGQKAIETRSWSTRYTGPIAIHAAIAFPSWARDMCWNEPFRSALVEAGYTRPQPNGEERLCTATLPTGAIVAVAELLYCSPIIGTSTVAPLELAFGDFSFGRYAWHLASVRRLAKPIPCKGKLGLWVPPKRVVDLIRAQLGRPVAV